MSQQQPQRHMHACDRAMTLEEISRVLGITRERVRQIEAKALKKLSRKAGFIEVLRIAARDANAKRNHGRTWVDDLPED